MRVCITLEHRFFGTPDGRVWTVTQCPYEFFRDYLEIFDSVKVIARVFPVSKVQPDYRPAEGPGVEFYAMPPYKGPYEFLRRYFECRNAAKGAVEVGDAVILRVHGQVANSVESWLRKRHVPFALEVVADPYDVFSPESNQHPVRPIARGYFTRRLKSQCMRAIAVSYVTRSYLQQRYPPAAKDLSTYYSSVSLKPESYVLEARPERQYATSFSDVSLSEEAYGGERPLFSTARLPRIVFVGTLESLYKGPDLLIEAAAICKSKGLELEIKFAGSGQQEELLKETSRKLCLEHVEFAGNVQAGVAVRRELDRADIFVLPSRAEGVPRAMLEAMARGLPCIGSTVGGIPEILDPEDMVPPNNAKALAQKLLEVLSNGQRLSEMSQRNLATAKTYSAAELSQRRRRFYQAVKALTAFHTKQRSDQETTPATDLAAINDEGI